MITQTVIEQDAGRTVNAAATSMEPVNPQPYKRIRLTKVVDGTTYVWPRAADSQVEADRLTAVLDSLEFNPEQWMRQ